MHDTSSPLRRGELSRIGRFYIPELRQDVATEALDRGRIVGVRGADDDLLDPGDDLLDPGLGEASETLHELVC